MKKLIFFVFALCLSVGAFAQSAVASTAAERTQNLDAIVNLTTSQEAQVLQINETRMQEAQSFVASNNQQAFRRTHKTRRNSIMSVLTATQKAALKVAIRSQNTLAKRNRI